MIRFQRENIMMALMAGVSFLALSTPVFSNAGAGGEENHSVRITDRGMQAKIYPVYSCLADAKVWQRNYEYWDNGAIILERAISFDSGAIELQLVHNFAGGAEKPIQNLGLRYSDGFFGHNWPRYVSTWCNNETKEKAWASGFFDVQINEQGLKDAPLTIESGNSGAIGYAVCNWDHSAGKIKARFLMAPEKKGLISEISVAVRETARVTVCFRYWPGGDAGKIWTPKGVLPRPGEHKKSLLTKGDDVLLCHKPEYDPEGKGASGVCGLSWLPEEISNAEVRWGCPVVLVFDLGEVEADETLWCHFGLWEMMMQRGEAAFQQLQRDAKEARSFILQNSNLEDPALAGRRKKDLDEYSALRKEFNQLWPASEPAGPKRPCRDFKSLPSREINLYWAKHFRKKADYSVWNGNGNDALVNITKALCFLKTSKMKRWWQKIPGAERVAERVGL